jgi:excisionase family DNA binding protein
MLRLGRTMPYRVLDSEQVAQYLHLSAEDVQRLIKSGDIPYEKRGGRIVFRKVDIETWASKRILGLEGRRLADYHRKSSEETSRFLQEQALVPDLLKARFIDPALPAKTRASVLREMAALASSTGRVNNPKALLESLEAREALCSTGLPGGLALMHPRHPDPYLFEGPFLALGRTSQQIPFGSPDGRSTDLFFLLACPDDRLHLHSLARICFMVQKTDLLSQLREAADAEEMHHAMLAAEQAVLSDVVRKS